MTDNQNIALQILNRIRDTQKPIINKVLNLEALRYKVSGAGAIRYDKDKVQTSPEDYMTQLMADIIELEAEIEEDIAGLEELKWNAYSIIRQIDEHDQRAILEWYYLNGIEMNVTADKLAMSERNAYYLRDDALESFGNIYQKTKFAEHFS